MAARGARSGRQFRWCTRVEISNHTALDGLPVTSSNRFVNEGQCSLSARLRMTSAARIASLRRKHHEQRKAAHHGEHGTVEKDGSMADMIP